jgi:hypothetical protein
MSKSTNTLSIILKLNERLFMNALKGITKDQAHERISGHNNPVSWLAPHTVDARYNILYFMGKPAMSPFKSLFENFRPYSSELEYPSLEATKAEWDKVSGLINEALAALTDEHSQAESGIKNPTGDSSNGGWMAFLAQHESYDIGQMGYLKKYLTQEAMAY